MTDEELRYPTGRFKPPVSYTQHNINAWINDIKTFPGKLRKEVIGLTEQQLDTQYRTGGWTIRQVVHHLADSHMNSIIRFKWALTEENPTIKAYEEADWAPLAASDYRLPIEPSFKNAGWYSSAPGCPVRQLYRRAMEPHFRSSGNRRRSFAETQPRDVFVAWQTPFGAYYGDGKKVLIVNSQW